MVVYDINSRKIYHRDLKPANFLVKWDKKGLIYLHLNDFGTVKSTIDNENREKTITGTNPGTLDY
jgi:serine/threonine protein kinase